jgi:hypothetical protein
MAENRMQDGRLAPEGGRVSNHEEELRRKGEI